MNLRTRLFFWITLTFLVAGALDFFLENLTTQTKIADAEKLLKAKIEQTSEEKRGKIQNFLRFTMAEKQAMVDFTLKQLTNFFLQVEHFAPIKANLDSGTWGDSANVMIQNRWLDFIQNTIEGQVVSCIVPRSSLLDISYTIPINEDCAWVIMSDELKAKKPLVGVRIPVDYKPGYQQPESEQILLRKGTLPEGYLLFSIEEFLQPSAKSLKTPIFQPNAPTNLGDLILPWAQGFRIILSKFYQTFSNTRAYLQKELGQLNQMNEDEVRAWIKKQLAAQGSDIDSLHLYPANTQNLSGDYIQKELNQLTIEFNQEGMIWVIASLFDSGIFGNDLFDGPSPKGIVVNRLGEKQGGGLHTVDAFYPKSFLNEAQYYQAHHDPNSIYNIGSSLAVFVGPDNHVYLGNSAQLLALENDEEKTGYLTMAIDAQGILQQLVETMGQMVFLVHEGRIYGGYSAKGEKIDPTKLSPLPLPQILAGTTGVIDWENTQYFYSHMDPFDGVDLHFIMLNPVAVEFAFTKYVVDGAISVVESILFNVHTIAFSTMFLVLFLLHHIALRITRPVTQLAQATKAIGEGHLDEVEIPHPAHSGDEVETLCTAFEQMVKGLREKEKVKAVLNKVVSQEIAQEILSGNIHLGGEEMKVTVLFADIRNFTHMTQNMPPQEVVDLLNACMTKISHVIDHNGGVIDKYVGDATMALFGAPVPHPHSALQAVQSALKIAEEMKSWNVDRAAAGKPTIEMGIGIHTGLVLAGNMGAENRLNYTVIGSNVNLASRLCTSAQGMEIRISKETLMEPHVQEMMQVESIGPVALKGFDQPVEVFRVVGGKT